MAQPSPNPIIPKQVIVRLPACHDKQEIFYNWNELNPKARFLIAPCGTKFGKSYGCSLWMAKEAMVNNGVYCVWIAPTYRKAKIGYRYIKAMLPDCEWINTVDGKLEIRLANGSTIVFLHGKDAEVTVEGEAIDRFVIDETGKITAQVWYSLLTTVTQTKGLGIVTGTPRGHTWYYKLYRRARYAKDKKYLAVTLKTEDSPFNSDESIEMVRRALPDHLYRQYYKAEFLSQSTVFGDLNPMWDEDLEDGDLIKSYLEGSDKPKLIETKGVKFWLHPDPKAREGEITHGVDLAKKQDWTVFYSVNSSGQVVGYVRFRKVEYKQASKRLRQYIERFFPACENVIRYDATGVGTSVGEHISEEFDLSPVDVMITGVTFTNKSKATWVTDTILAIEQGWLKSPKIEEIEAEFASYEVNVTLNGNFQYKAPEGEHDDIVSAALLAVSYGFNQNRCAEGEKALEDMMSGSTDNEDIIAAYADMVTGEEDEYFDQDNNEEDIDFDEETA